MAFSDSGLRRPLNRRRFLKAGIFGAAGLAIYSGEIERHWVEVTHSDVHLRRLPEAFHGFRIAQISDIHMDEYTEAFFLRHVVRLIDGLQPDAVFLTGDFVSNGPRSRRFSRGAAWECANILNELKCLQRYAIMGNHDAIVGEKDVTAALEANRITVLNNSYLPLERGGSRVWLAGLDDPLEGRPDIDLTLPDAIRNTANEPVILMCHAPDYVDRLLKHPAGGAVDLMLSGHTHGGQVRLPFLPALNLPSLGKKYIEGWFRFGEMQLYVNRGVGTVGLPFRLRCPPEITLLTLRSDAGRAA
jgi:predicted MPP superfamily phosphohydrolase